MHASFLTRANRHWAGWFLSLLVLSALAGCASLSPADTEEWRASQSIRLQERAEARWAALIAGDFEKAYGYQSPGYRTVASLQQFRGGFGSNVNWRVAHAGIVQYDSPISAVVSVSVTYGASLLRGGGDFESARAIPERWVYSEGDWWYISVK